MNKEITTFGLLNGSAVGIIMKELVRRAIVAIRNQKQVFDVCSKEGHSGDMDDFFKSADNAAQKIYIRSIIECFPTLGLIAEEGLFRVPCTDGSGLCFTIDPLDGTKAFIRRQSHGVGTMISLFKEGDRFLAAYVGDVNTQEIYGFRPGSDKVNRITEFNISEDLRIDNRPLSEQCVMLRDPESAYSPCSQQLIHPVFKNQVIDGGSIGTWFARLWKGEVGAALLPHSMETPWDSNPVNAISLKLGFAFLKPTSDNKRWEKHWPKPIVQKFKRRHDVLVVHRSNLGEIPDSWVC